MLTSFFSAAQNGPELGFQDFIIIVAFLGLWVFVLVAWVIEYLAARATLAMSEHVTRMAHFTNCSASILVPCWLIQTTSCHFFFGAPYLFMAIVVFLKLVSYAHTNTVLRMRWLSGDNNNKNDKTTVPAINVKQTLSRKNSMATVPFLENKSADGSSVKYPKNLTFANAIMFQLYPTLW